MSRRILGGVFILTSIVFGMRVGERIEYKAQYGFLELGSMVLEVLDTINYAGKKCYVLSSRLNSNPELGFIFSLNDTIEVWTTIDSFLPVVYKKGVHEGKYTNLTRLEFDHRKLLVYEGGSLKDTLLYPARDLLSYWYYLRTIPLIEGDTSNVIIYEGEDNNDVQCIIDKKINLKTKLGNFLATKLKLRTKAKGVLGSSGSMEIWYSTDSNRLPLQIKTHLKFGTVIFKIVGVSY